MMRLLSEIFPDTAFEGKRLVGLMAEFIEFFADVEGSAFGLYQ